MRLVVTLSSLLLSFSLLSSCASSSLTKKGKASRVTEPNQAEIEEDQARPFLSLRETLKTPESIELWRPTGRSSVWTPKGDAYFYAGHGAKLIFKDKSLQYFTKEASGGREYLPARVLNEEEWASFLDAYQKMALVNVEGPERSCSPSLTEGYTFLEERDAEGRLEIVLNYRRAPCRTTFTDTLSFERLFQWFETHGAPWKA